MPQHGQFYIKPFARTGSRITARGASAERYGNASGEDRQNDSAFCDALTRAVMGEYVEKIWPNNPGMMGEYMYRNRLNLSTTQIIQAQGKPIGRIAIQINDDCIKLDNLQLMPEYQKKGIGSEIMRQLIAFSKEEQKPIHLLVLENNPAIHLYERCGFTAVGEKDHRIIMQRPYDLMVEKSGMVK